MGRLETVVQLQLEYLKRLEVVLPDYGISRVLKRICDLKVHGYFPALKTICVLKENVTIHEYEKALNFLPDLRKIGVELYLIKTNAEKLAIDFGLIKAKHIDQRI